MTRRKRQRAGLALVLVLILMAVAAVIGMSCLYTSSLLPGYLPGALPGYPVGELILEWASCLDAFSAYPFRT